MHDKFLTVSETAHRLGLSADSIRRYERNGTLPAIRTGKGQRLFTPADVEQLESARAHRKASTQRNSISEK